MDFKSFLEHFSDVENHNSYYLATCPCAENHNHGDANKSLWIKAAANKILIRCLSQQCDKLDILHRVGLNYADLDRGKQLIDLDSSLYAAAKNAARNLCDDKKVKEIYDYCDRNGNYAWSKVMVRGTNKRTGKPDKSAFICQIDYSTGRYTTGIGKAKTKAPLYRLPELVKAVKEKPGRQVIYVEGEKDVETLTGLGFLSTTAGSVSDWRPEYSRYFKGLDVAMLADNDDAGRKLKDRFCRDVARTAKCVRWTHTSQKPKGDVTDYLSEGHQPYELGQLIMSAAVWMDKLQLPEAKEPETGKPEIKQLLRLSKTGSVLNCPTNFVTILSNTKTLSNAFRKNMFSGRIEVTGVPWELDTHTFTDEDESHIAAWIDDHFELHGRDNLNTALVHLATIPERRYHPVLDELAKIEEWDGVRRIDDLFPFFLGAKKCLYTSFVTRLLFNALIMRVKQPGVKFDQAIILVSPQGSGKSSLCRFLALRDEWFTDSIQTFNEKTVESLLGHWVCELGEMTAFRNTKTVEAVKRFLSATSDTYRFPYDRHTRDVKRQSVFVGTSNSVDCLPSDPTGNRRFLPIFCDGKAEKHPLSDEAFTREFVKQCFAEALADGKARGFDLVLPREAAEIAEKLQAAATPEDSRVGVIQAYLDNHPEIVKVCTRQIAMEVLEHQDGKEPTRAELTDIAAILTNKINGWVRYRGEDGASEVGKLRFPKYGVQKAWVRVSLASKFEKMEQTFN